MGPFPESLLTPGDADWIHMLAGGDTPSAAAIEGAVQRGTQMADVAVVMSRRIRSVWYSLRFGKGWLDC
jgi:hypothetical protein